MVGGDIDLARGIIIRLPCKYIFLRIKRKHENGFATRVGKSHLAQPKHHSHAITYSCPRPTDDICTLTSIQNRMMGLENTARRGNNATFDGANSVPQWCHATCHYGAMLPAGDPGKDPFNGANSVPCCPRVLQVPGKDPNDCAKQRATMVPTACRDGAKYVPSACHVARG